VVSRQKDQDISTTRRPYEGLPIGWYSKEGFMHTLFRFHSCRTKFRKRPGPYLQNFLTKLLKGRKKKSH